EKAEQAKDSNAPAAAPGDEAKTLVLPPADETLRKPNKCEKQPFAAEKSDGNCWVLQEVDGVRIYRSRFPFWEAHRSLEKVGNRLTDLMVDSTIDTLAKKRATVDQRATDRLIESVLETLFLPRQLTEVADVYYKVVYDWSYSPQHLGFISEEISK